MMWDQQFVVFISPWSTGKTICQREKARIWAKDNPSENLYFCVVRDYFTTNTTLLEMELKHYFEEHNLQNVTVLGLPTFHENTMSELHQKMSSMPGGSWMIDELVMPDPRLPLPNDHTKWAGELLMMRSHMVGQPGHYLLWISVAGIAGGKPKHFKHNYLAPLMSGFHVPLMELPLRNTKRVIKLAGLDSNNANKTASIPGGRTFPSYTLPPHLMSGVQCQQIKVKKNDDAELSKAVEEGCRVIMQRTAGSGFPVLLDHSSSVTQTVSISTVAAAVLQCRPALLYTHNGREKNEAKEAEVEKWLRRWKRGEERRALVADEGISRGWETPAVMVIGEYGTENLVMRACGFCFLIRLE